VYVYNFADLQLLHQIETCPNPKGLCALSSSTNTVLAVPGTKVGFIHLELYDLKSQYEIQAHNNSLTQMVLNLEGTRLATSSEKGTLIRIFDTKTGDQLKEFRRGADKAEIYCIAFSPNSQWICVSSDKGTVHVYGVATAEPQPTEEKKQTEESLAKNSKSSLSFMKEILPSYFSSEWSFANFRVQESHCVVCFGTVEKNSIIVVCADGSYYKYSFDLIKGGECKQETFGRFLQSKQ